VVAVSLAALIGAAVLLTLILTRRAFTARAAGRWTEVGA
jgi:hypothetical protein